MSEVREELEDGNSASGEQEDIQESADNVEVTRPELESVEFLNIKEEYITEEEMDDEGSSQVLEATEIDANEFQLNISGWPVAVNFETVGESDNVESNRNEENSNHEDSLKDTTDDGMDDETMASSSSSFENENSSDMEVNAAINIRKRKKVLKMRTPKRHAPQVFKCTECFLQFTSQIELSVHMYTLHKLNNHIYLSRNKLMCRLCKQIFVNKTYLEAHINNVHTEKRTINCIKCQKVFKYRSYITANKRSLSQYTERKFTCLHCNLNRKT